MSNHPPDPGKMVCRHNAPDPILGTRSVCAHCGVPIGAKPCVACDGMGMNKRWMLKCRVCRGTGIDRWEAVS